MVPEEVDDSVAQPCLVAFQENRLSQGRTYEFRGAPIINGWGHYVAAIGR